ncbi:helix-turn-helix domain-containing protein [Paenibacillus abyssi]|uniref:HTH cro/C1-type domain-containing protein n=1 Tax=Paenibacillus abyssi TaxID=1340531 RepID=A0A917LHJ1_9BACL|nr:helix-turn-helix transcriptional regulator [Paenibacillus abyssi]GGG23889.1 hypothetical protein GCM10010916_45550 [Paenibacillus abyssi]
MTDKKGSNMRKKDITLGRVKELREIKNLTQLEFAESIDVSSNTISRIERGEMSLSSDLALKIADTYGISLDWLFYRGNEQLSPKLRANLEEAFKCIQESTSIPIRLKINKKTPSD